MPDEILMSQKLIAEHEMASRKLFDLKSNGVRFLATDLDGTVMDRLNPTFNLLSVIQLGYEATRNGVNFAIISARNTTIELDLRELALQFCREKNTSFSLWRSGGNGMNLCKVTSNPEEVKVQSIYSNALTADDAQKALEAYIDLHIDNPDGKSQLFVQSFLKRNIPVDLVPKSFLELSKPYNGLVFAEAVKISFVLPTAFEDQERCIGLLRETLEPHGLVVNWARMPFADISKRSDIDGKLFAVQTLMKLLQLDASHVGTFGDAPNDSDKGLVSLPFGFTNYQGVEKGDIHSPPFILDVKDSPIGAVHNAIRFLI